MSRVIKAVFVFISIFIPVHVTAQTHTLVQGWNLEGNDNGTPIDVNAIFGSTTNPTAISSSVISVWAWNKNTAQWDFFAPSMSSSALATYTASRGFGVLTTITQGQGFWVNTNNAVSVNLAAPPATSGSTCLPPWMTALGGESGDAANSPEAQPTTMTGVVTPPPTPTAVTALSFPAYAGPTASTDMRLPKMSPYSSYATIVQGWDYSFDNAVAPTMKVASLSIYAVNPTAPTNLATGELAYASDQARGQLSQITTSWPPSARVSAGDLLYYQDTALGGMPAAVYSWGGNLSFMVGYVVPHSATQNPSGYTYQTFGFWIYGGRSESWFSIGIPTATNLPTSGTATYTGVMEATQVDAVTRTPADIMSTMTATVDFGARTVSFASTASAIACNAPSPDTLPAANSGLNMSGTLGYVSGSNTFTGPVNTANGMSGNVTCRFYGPGIAASTATKTMAAPPEIGCTFAVMGSGVGAMEGASGGK